MSIDVPEGEGAEPVRPTDPRLRQLTDLKGRNKAKLAELRRGGVALNLDSFKLDVLLDAIFTPEDRLAFDLMYEDRLAAAMTQAETNVNRVRLTAGITSPPPPTPSPTGPRA